MLSVDGRTHLICILRAEICAKSIFTLFIKNDAQILALSHTFVCICFLIFGTDRNELSGTVATRAVVLELLSLALEKTLVEVGFVVQTTLGTQGFFLALVITAALSQILDFLVGTSHALEVVISNVVFGANGVEGVRTLAAGSQIIYFHILTFKFTKRVVVFVVFSTNLHLLSVFALFLATAGTHLQQLHSRAFQSTIIGVGHQVAPTHKVGDSVIAYAAVAYILYLHGSAVRLADVSVSLVVLSTHHICLLLLTLLLTVTFSEVAEGNIRAIQETSVLIGLSVHSANLTYRLVTITFLTESVVFLLHSLHTGHLTPIEVVFVVYATYWLIILGASIDSAVNSFSSFQIQENFLRTSYLSSLRNSILR